MSIKLKKYKGFKLPVAEISVLKEAKGMVESSSKRKFTIGTTEGVGLSLTGKYSAEVRDNHIVHLNLSRCNLTELPDLSDLTLLQFISLHDNKLTKIHESLGNLKQLENIDLRKNKLTKIPEFFENLKPYSDIRLNGNRLESIPEWIKKRNPIVIHSFGWYFKIPSKADPSRVIRLHFDLNELLTVIIKDYYLDTHILGLLKFLDIHMDLVDKNELLDYLDQIHVVSSLNDPNASNRVNFVLGLIYVLSLGAATYYRARKIVMKILDLLGTNLLEDLIDNIFDENGCLLCTALTALNHVDNHESTRIRVREKILQSIIKYAGPCSLFDTLEALLIYISPQEIYEVMDKNKELIKDHNNSSMELISEELIYAFEGEDITGQGIHIIKELGPSLVETLINRPRLDNGEIDELEAYEVKRILQYIDVDRISEDHHKFFVEYIKKIELHVGKPIEQDNLKYFKTSKEFNLFSQVFKEKIR